MKAYVFPGQGAQFTGMGKDLFDTMPLAKELFLKADEILGFEIHKIMFYGTEEELKQTKITQPAIFLHSTILAACLGDSFVPEMVAGHSLGEISALVANKALSFEDGLNLVYKRALAMQKACEAQPSTMAAIIGLEDHVIEDVCSTIEVISGEVNAVEEACVKLKEAGAKMAVILQVGGAFHSPLMESAREELAKAIEATNFSQPICPIYQNVKAAAVSDPAEIKQNLIEQLTAPVRWTQTMQKMIADGATSVTEVGPGKVLQGLFKKVDRSFSTSSASLD